MKIIPLAAESLGVRSAAYFVETNDVKILIDPGVSLAVLRHGLPPHPLEIRAMNEAWARIKEHAARADVLVITHYHFDHFDPTEPLVFNNKTLLLKHPKEQINARQKERARWLSKNFRMLPRRVEFADGNEFAFGDTIVRFSPAVPHGPTTKVGWVVQVAVRDKDSCFLHTSDIQGACLPEQVNFIRAMNPDTLYLDGPLSYMIGQSEFSRDDLQASIKNTIHLLETTSVRTIIMDHHLLRDEHWKKNVSALFEKAEQLGKRIVTAAGYLDQEDEILEAHRRQLFAYHPEMPEEPIKRSKSFHLVQELRKS